VSDQSGVPPVGGAPVPPRVPRPAAHAAAPVDGTPPAPGTPETGTQPESAGTPGVGVRPETGGTEAGAGPIAGAVSGPAMPATHGPVDGGVAAAYRIDGTRAFEESYDTGRLQQLPTGQLLLVHRPGLPDSGPVPAADDDDEVQRRVFSWIGAVVGTVGAIASLFVGWMLPLSIAALVFGVLGLRREEHGRTLAFVAVGTGVTGLVFSAVWLGYYAIIYGALPA